MEIGNLPSDEDRSVTERLLHSQLPGYIAGKQQEENTEKLDTVKNQNEERMKNELLIALSEELQSELKSEIFPERLDILFETVNSQGSF